MTFGKITETPGLLQSEDETRNLALMNILEAQAQLSKGHAVLMVVKRTRKA